MPSNVPWEPTRLIDALRDAAKAITVNAEPIGRYLELASRTREFDEWIRVNSLPAKKTYARLTLDYYLSRQSLWIEETISLFEKTHPEIRKLGPSLILLVREAARRLEREGRGRELMPFIREAVEGVPRSMLRHRYLPKAGVAHATPPGPAPESIGAALELALIRGGA